jgi:hypothetical protein
MAGQCRHRPPLARQARLAAMGREYPSTSLGIGLGTVLFVTIGDI